MPRGGRRPGTGGARPGAGRPRKNQAPEPAAQGEAATPQQAVDKSTQPLDYMLGVMRDPNADAKLRAQMAVAAAPYVHAKIGEQGKKESKDDAATRLSTGGRFAAPPPPRLTDRSRH